MNIGENIKQIRKSKKMTQRELGEKIGGISQQQIGQWENNIKKPKIETLEKIAIGLGVPLSELLDIKQYYVTKELLMEHPELKEEISKIILEELRDYEEINFEKKFANATIEEFVELIKFIVISVELDNNFNIISVNMAVSSRKSILLDAFEKLTLDGQKEAVKRVQELTEVPKYRNNKVDKELERFSNMFK